MHFLHYLKKIDSQHAAISIKVQAKRKIIPFDSDLIKVLKANVFLLLYNLAESSIKQSISEIYENVSAERVCYGDVKDEIRKIWIFENHKNFKNKSTENIYATMQNLASDIIDIKFNPERVISGNIDGRKIKEFSKAIGFSDTVDSAANDGHKLHLVKTQRNNLAHGQMSFCECGRNYSVSELNIAKKRSHPFSSKHIAQYSKIYRKQRVQNLSGS